MKLRFLTAALAVHAVSANVVADEASLDSTLLESLGDVPDEQTIQSAFLANPEQVLDVLTALLSNQVVDPQTAITQALTVSPELVDEIVEIARQAGVSNEIITTSALLAGLDPTVVAEATAAGIQTASSIAPPAAPAVGSDGGGGSAVVSPN